MHMRGRHHHSTSTSNDRAIVAGQNDTIRLGEHDSGSLQQLCGELGAPLAATRTEDGAAGARAHAKTEAVHLGPTTVVRLEGSLAHSGISKAQL